MTDSAVAAALGTIGFLVASTVLLGLDAAESLRPYLLTRYWLAFVDLFRDPIRWPDVIHGVLAQLAYLVVFAGAAWANFATQGRQQVTSAGSLRRSGTERAAQRGQHDRVTRQLAVRGRRAGADLLHLDVQRPLELGGLGGRHRLVRVGAHRDPARAGRGLVAGVQPAQQVAAGGQLLARSRAATGHLLRERRDVGAVVRRAQRQHPSYDGIPTLVPHEQPRDHSPGRVADHVDGLRPALVERALGQVGEPAGLHAQVSPTALGRLEDDHLATVARAAGRRAGRGRSCCRRTRGPRSPARGQPGRTGPPPMLRPTRTATPATAASTTIPTTTRTRRRRAGGAGRPAQ